MARDVSLGAKSPRRMRSFFIVVLASEVDEGRGLGHPGSYSSTDGVELFVDIHEKGIAHPTPHFLW